MRWSKSPSETASLPSGAASTPANIRCEHPCTKICPRPPANAGHRHCCQAVGVKPVQFMPADDRSDETIRQSFESANERAISILGRVLAGGAEATAEVHAWTTWLQSHQLGDNSLTVLEHTVVAYILRSGFLNRFPESRCHLDVESVLRTSWLHLIERSTRLSKANDAHISIKKCTKIFMR